MASIRRLEVYVLKKKSQRFLEEAKNALSKGFYDLACFLAKQALQLYLKALLLEICR